MSDQAIDLTWEEYLRAAVDQGSTEQTLRELSTICVRADRVSYENAMIPGLPVSRPPRAVVHSAAAHLESLVDELERSGTRIPGLDLPAFRATAWMFRRWRDDEQPEARWSSTREAVDLADREADALTAGWLHTLRADELYRAQRRSQAVSAAERAVARLDETPDGRSSGPLSAVDRDLFAVSTAPAVRSVVLQFALYVRGLAARDTGDVHAWQVAVTRRVELARGISTERPSALGMALRNQIELERFVGGTPDLTELEALATTSTAAATNLMVAKATGLRALGDYDGVVAIQLDRVAHVARIRGLKVSGREPDEIFAYAASLPQNRRRQLNSIANGAYEIASALVLSGRTLNSDEDAAKADAWLRVTEAIWAGWAGNGLYAIAYRRAVLLADTDPDTARGQLFTVAREAIRAGLRVNAAFYAAVHLPTPDHATADLLDRMLEESWSSSERVRLLAARAWAQRGMAWTRDTRAADLQEAASLAAESMPAGLVEAWARLHWVAAELALERNDLDQLASSAREAIVCVTRLLHHASTSEQRRFLATHWSPLFLLAFEASESANDARLGDLIAEAVRRDGVGLALTQATQDAAIPRDLAEIIAQSVTADRADADDATRTDAAGPEGDQADEEAPDDSGPQRLRSALNVEITQRRSSALSAARQALGALGALMDPSSVISARAERIIRGRGNDGPTFILQLVAGNHPLVNDSRPVVHRRLTGLVDGQLLEIADRCEVPGSLLTGDPGHTLDSIAHAGVLIPDALRYALRAADPTTPVRVLIVPTGLFHVPWDAVMVGGRPLIERALTSVHTSLTSIDHLLGIEGSRPSSGSVAIFDPELPATARERQALAASFPALVEDRWHETLSSPTPPDPRVMAWSVHGTDDEEGWAQAKIIPGHGELTAAESLGFQFPDICVLASCHSRVGSSGQMDLAGFPTAMFARGARTIIGSVGAIPDESTSEILAEFYARLSVSGDPVAALRDARLGWLDRHPWAWRSPFTWGQLVAYGGAHH